MCPMQALSMMCAVQCTYLASISSGFWYWAISCSLCQSRRQVSSMSRVFNSRDLMCHICVRIACAATRITCIQS
ncbi:hypothetical protein DFH09DRAFT_1169515 [Mycena vulgaris]|nr:hypothetical protein DFH09DRAFT_1169515 [Mycena vulgaris]